MSELPDNEIPRPVHISTGVPRQRRLSIAAMAAMVLSASPAMAMGSGIGFPGMGFSSQPRRETEKSQDMEKIEKARMKREMRANKLLKQKPL